MRRDPLVSIIIPAYNYAAFLPHALDSALAQPRDLCEVVVADDGSTDDTPRVLDAYASRVRVLTQANRGLSAARVRRRRPARPGRAAGASGAAAGRFARGRGLLQARERPQGLGLQFQRDRAAFPQVAQVVDQRGEGGGTAVGHGTGIISQWRVGVKAGLRTPGVAYRRQVYPLSSR